MQAKVKNTRTAKYWTIEAVETGSLTAKHLKSRGFDGTIYSAKRTLKDGREAVVMAYRQTSDNAFVCAY